MTSSVLRVEVITFSLNCRLTEVTLETVELAAGVEPTSLVCALAAVDMRSSAKAAAAEGRKDLNIETSKWLSVLSIRRMSAWPSIFWHTIMVCGMRRFGAYVQS